MDIDEDNPSSCGTAEGCPWSPLCSNVFRVFVFGPQDTMSGEVALDVPSTLHDSQPGLVSPISIRPSNTSVDVIVTAPTPPISILNDRLDSASSRPVRGAPNGTINRRDRDTRPNSLPNQPRPSPRHPRDRLGRHKTISGVTEEARKVLEQFLTKSLSPDEGLVTLSDSVSLLPKNTDTKLPHPATRGSSLPAGGYDDDIDGLPDHHKGAGGDSSHPASQGAVGDSLQGAAAYQPTSQGPAAYQPTSQGPAAYQPTSQGAAAYQPTSHGAAAYQPTSYHDCVAMPDDDNTSHSPISCPNSLYSFSSRSSSHRNRIQINKSIKDEKELRRAAELEQRKRKNKKKRGRERRLDRRNSTGSSTSSEYEIVNGQLQLRRKKSLFKRAKERIQASFRRKKTSPGFDPYRIDDDEIREAQEDKPTSQNKKTFSFRLPRRTRSSAERSPTLERDAGREIRRHQSQGHPEASRWAVFREPSQEKDTRGIFDSILRSLRKSSGKLGLKKNSKEGSDGVPTRSRSADHIAHHGIHQHPAGRGLYPEMYPNTTRNHQHEGSYPNTTRNHQHEGSTRSYCRCQSADGTRPHHPALQSDAFVGGANHRALPNHNSDSAYHPPGPTPPNADRSQLRLQGLVPNGPAPRGVNGMLHPPPTSDHAPSPNRLTVIDDERSQRGSSVEHSGQDDVDGAGISTCDPTNHQDQVVHKPFAQKTDQEKEELYEKIAAQLAAIADNYNLDSPRSLKNDLFTSSPLGGSTIPKSASAPAAAAAVNPTTSPPTSPPNPTQEGEDEVEGATAAPGLLVAASGDGHTTRGGGRTPIEQKIGRILRDRGDKATADMTELEPVVSELVRNASYSRFQQIIHENVGGEPGWQQVAILFNLTRSAVQLAGLGTAAALQIKELTLRYFEDKFAGWIVGQGGWESMVEDTDLSSEVD